jgi:bifunctional non-homologous end joining protein LigD
VRLVAHHVGAEVHAGSPRVSAELPETGERFEGLLPPVVAAPTFAIRKPAVAVFTLNDYVAAGIMTSDQAEALRAPINTPVDTTRRRFLAVAAFASVAGADSLAAVASMPPALASPPDPIFAVIDRHRKACAAHNEAAQRETLAIAGFALDGKKWDGIYLGRRRGNELIYAGKVDHGFDSASAKELQARLKPLIRTTQPYAKKIAHRGIWVEPSLLAEIEYRAKSAEGKVCHPFFKGIREDL